YSQAQTMNHVKGELGIYLSEQCSIPSNVERNGEGNTLVVTVGSEGSELADTIRPEALASLSQAPNSIRSLAAQLVKENCDGSGGQGESPVLVGMPATDRANQLGIELDTAIELNTFLMNSVSDPCSPTLILQPAVEVRDVETRGNFNNQTI
ncbi:MAG: hypothetical protein AAF202_11900, partial [Pseudomonadota bacterium]